MKRENVHTAQHVMLSLLKLTETARMCPKRWQKTARESKTRGHTHILDNRFQNLWACYFTCGTNQLICSVKKVSVLRLTFTQNYRSIVELFSMCFPPLLVRSLWMLMSCERAENVVSMGNETADIKLKYTIQLQRWLRILGTHLCCDLIGWN